MTRKSCRTYDKDPLKFDGKTLFIVKDEGSSMPLVLYCQTHNLKYNTILSRIFRANIKSETGIMELRPGRNQLHAKILSPQLNRAGRKSIA